MLTRTWETATVARQNRLDYWRDAVCDAFLRVRMDPAESRAFSGSIRSQALGGYLANGVRSTRHVIRRSRGDIGRSAEDCFFLNRQVLGTCVLEQAGRRQTVRPGEFALFDSARPFDLDFRDDMALGCLVIPKARMRTRLPQAEDLVALPLSDSGPARMLLQFCGRLETELPSTAAADGEGLADIVIDLLALSYQAGLPGRARADLDPASMDAVRLARVLQVVRLRHADPDLSLARVAAEVGLSVRSVQALFTRHGASFGAALREQRLDSATRLLESSPLTVTDVALAAGFSDVSHFCRLFRDRQGCSARQYRDQTRAAGRRAKLDKSGPM